MNPVDHVSRPICGASWVHQFVDDLPQLLLRTSKRFTPSAKEVDRRTDAQARDQAVHFRNEFSRTLWPKVSAKDWGASWLVPPNWRSAAQCPAKRSDHVGLLVAKIASQNRVVWNLDDQLIGFFLIERRLESAKEIRVVEVRSADDEELPHRLNIE